MSVRLHALKSIAREVQQMHELVAHYALAHPRVASSCTMTADVSLRLLCRPLATSALLVLGRELAAQMLPVRWQSVDLHIQGAVSVPAVNRATRQRQYFWVNGRPIRSGFLSIAVARAYGGLLPPGRHPVIALGLTLPAEFLDVNVHPRKTEIRFLQERAVFAAVQAVEQVMQQYPLGRSWEEGSDFTAWAEQAPVPAGVGEEAPPCPGIPDGCIAAATTWAGRQHLVIAHGPQGLLVLDQHAAHERLLYDRLLAAEEPGIELAEAFVLHLPSQQQQWLLPLSSRCYRVCGLHLEPFGKVR